MLGNLQNIWKLYNTFLNNKTGQKRNHKEIRKYFDSNKNEGYKK